MMAQGKVIAQAAVEVFNEGAGARDGGERTEHGLKRQVRLLTRQVAALEVLGRGQAAIPPAPTPLAEKARFSPGWIKTRREKLKLSANDYGRLIGVSALTVYKWEGGKSRPRKEALARLVAVKDIGRQEALRRLETLAGEKKRPAAKPVKKKATKGRRRTGR